MEKIYKDFIEGEEVRTIKKLLAATNMYMLVGAVFAYGVLLDFITRPVLYVTCAAISSLFVTHFLRKWLRAP